jgi:hypothetical protein
MQKLEAKPSRANRNPKMSEINFGGGRWLAVLAAGWVASPVSHAVAADNATPSLSDPVLNLLLEKGMITEGEAAKVQAQVDSYHTNAIAELPPEKWKFSKGIKDVELYGDVRMRYEDRKAIDPDGGHVQLDRVRYAVRVGLRGDLFDDFNYGIRVETSSNPRSTWVTLGSPNLTSPGSSPYQGPFGKSASGINIGQVYFGWHPEDWVDITLGKMPNPLYTTTMVWSPSINPEGAAEHFKYQVGAADLSATFAQFVYADSNPTSASSGYFNLFNSDDSNGDLPLLLAWQGGVDYHLTKKADFKIVPTIYNYTRFKNGQSPNSNANGYTPDFSGTYVGQGTTIGINNTAAFYNYANGTPGFDGFYANQTGINDLLILEIPFEFNLKLDKVDLRLFGDYAQNLDGSKRAQAAYNAAHSTYFSLAGQAPYLSQIPSAQTGDNTAYQIGFAVGSSGAIGLVHGSSAKKNSWEFRTYWQHIEQYSLDPNLIDTDFFEGDENMQGIYTAVAYGFTDNFIGTVRYGYANRINNKLGTGGSGQDIPQMNPISDFSLLQVDLTLRF